MAAFNIRYLIILKYVKARVSKFVIDRKKIRTTYWSDYPGRMPVRGINVGLVASESVLICIIFARRRDRALSLNIISYAIFTFRVKTGSGPTLL